MNKTSRYLNSFTGSDSLPIWSGQPTLFQLRTIASDLEVPIVIPANSNSGANCSSACWTSLLNEINEATSLQRCNPKQTELDTLWSLTVLRKCLTESMTKGSTKSNTHSSCTGSKWPLIRGHIPQTVEAPPTRHYEGNGHGRTLLKVLQYLFILFWRI